MRDFQNTVGFITGGAGGIGLGVARALGQRGMTLVLADIESDTLDATAANLRREGMTVHTEVLDVSDHKAYSEVAARTLARHGSVQFLFNNAGVAGPSPIVGGAMQDWRWVMDVNVMGVVHGVDLFLPSMLESGRESYIVNTASLAGHAGHPGMASYCASKFAVVGYSETLRLELAESKVNTAVLCPGWVKTQIAQSLRNHPDPELSKVEHENLTEIGRIIDEEGISIESVAERVVSGMAAKTFYLFTHASFWPAMDERLTRIRNDYAEVLD